MLGQRVELNYRKLNDYLPLIRFNAEYFEYAIVWAQVGVSFEYFKQKWKDYLNADLPLQPYVVSLQIPNLIIAMNLFGVYDQEIYDSLFSRYKWLIKHQEKHLLANHYFENLKTIVIASYIFGEERIFKRYIKKFQKECEEQILKDGVHYELSLMYHKIILEDLLLVNRICCSKWLKEYIQLMADASYSLEDGFNRTPLFNDAGNNVSKSVDSLMIAANNELGIIPNYQNSFLQAGYYKLKNNDVSVLIDAGKIGPNYNPGHSHCDCLSFELFVNKEPLFVNSGTYQYQGEMRQFFRSTEAHNTIMVSNHEQSALWGEHRAGKRIKNVSGSLHNGHFSGKFTNQCKEKCLRQIFLDQNQFCVLDSTEKTKSNIDAHSYLHLAPGYSYQEGKIVGFGNCYLLNTINCAITQKESVYSSNFGVIKKNICLVFSWKTDKEKHGYCISLSS